MVQFRMVASPPAMAMPPPECARFPLRVQLIRSIAPADQIAPPLAAVFPENVHPLASIRPAAVTWAPPPSAIAQSLSSSNPAVDRPLVIVTLLIDTAAPF